MTPETRKSAPKTPVELRRFGLVMSVPLAAIAAFVAWKGGNGWWIPAMAAVLFVVGALAFPSVLRPVEWAWMKFALVLSAVMTRVVLAVAFFVILTPFAFVVKLLRKDLLGRRFVPDRTSYWDPTDPEGPASRPTKPF